MEKISDFRTRLEEMLAERGIRAAQLCRDSGLNKATVSQYLKGVYEPKHEQLCKIAEALEVTPRWLEGYDTVKYASDASEQVCRVGVYTIDDLSTPKRYEVCDPAYKDCIYIEADDHFYPAVNSGDLVLIKKASELEYGMAALVSFRQYYGLYICEARPDCVILRCLNGYYPCVTVRNDELSQMNIIGRVILSMRKW